MYDSDRAAGSLQRRHGRFRHVSIGCDLGRGNYDEDNNHLGDEHHHKPHLHFQHPHVDHHQLDDDHIDVFHFVKLDRFQLDK
mmetsp:Transcript_103592/g.333862  ORF Transcript_103592/g.333862 Transcript_103592/m.333862 type:complete len:82 (+) Transcript_103592:422-667(+)